MRFLSALDPVKRLCVIAVCLIVANVALDGRAVQAEEHAMKSKVIHQPAFTVVGIAARTSNAKEATADGVIGKQWERFMKEGVLAKIPNKVDSAIVAVYTDYASDKDGEYTFVLGAKVKSDHDIPDGMLARKVPAGRYAVFTSEKGPAARVVAETWKRIWSVQKSTPGGNRAFKADFEVYDERAADPQNMQVDVYVGVK